MLGARLLTIGAAVSVALSAAACGGGGNSSENPALVSPNTTTHDLSHVTCTPSGTSLALSADNFLFDKDCLAVPANQPFTIAFANRQKDIPHNVAILTSQENGQMLFRGGDPFPGVATMVYNGPPLPPGNYYFHCEVHPTQMQGNFIVQ